jgi:hypothetical protein
MAKIPIFPPNYITVTQIFPTYQTDNGGSPATNSSGIPLGMALNITSPATIDINQIIGVGEYYDTILKQLVNARQLYITGTAGLGGSMGMIVQDSYNTIKAYLDARDCTNLCSDV